MNREDFGELGLQYYISGRYSFFCSFAITGNLLHHAVEMFLKMGLCKSFTERQLRSRSLGHNLKVLWTEFKRLYPVGSLSKHDTTIDTLDMWEEIRYPSQVFRHERLRLDRTIPLPSSGGGPAPRLYDIILEEVDELVVDIFKASNISPKILKRVFIGMPAAGPVAKKFYELENRHQLSFDK